MDRKELIQNVSGVLFSLLMMFLVWAVTVVYYG